MDKTTQETDMIKTNFMGSTVLKKYSKANPFIILKSITYEMGLKYPEYLPCLNAVTIF